MKKQLLIAAVAATMASVSMADISITGAAQVNYLNTDSSNGTSANAISHDFDLKITGQSGATSVVMDIENLVASNSAGLNVKSAYMSNSMAGVNAKVGTWYGADSLLANGTQTQGQVSLDTTISGVKVQYETSGTNLTTSSVTLSGSVAGVALSHEIHDASTDTSVSGSFGGVNVAYRSIDSDLANSDESSLEVSTEVQGVTLTYAEIDVDGTGNTTSDAFFGTFDGTTTACGVASAGTDCINEATGFGASMALAGNTVTLKSYDVKTISTNSDDSYTKVVVNRPLASGATLEVTYTDKDAQGTDTNVETLDIELAVKF